MVVKYCRKSTFEDLIPSNAEDLRRRGPRLLGYCIYIYIHWLDGHPSPFLALKHPEWLIWIRPAHQQHTQQLGVAQQGRGVDRPEARHASQKQRKLTMVKPLDKWLMVIHDGE